ncbi:protoporphyrinogen oxidase [Bacillus sp. HMF5848]|uniref:protoporphyrinogen oxidase n=1 Tax=Bacillus sp. HMF5848 TaxID=2495421 RepID=UPI000F7AABB4|nr:protoporphyrinogen oxidase [Bacillus sp. HMF5848]RSK26339.1 protoporphyrinogen oxidase [Bacillus sp. HMF5848]
MSDERRHVVIIGGGITGMAAAFYMQKAAEKENTPLSITLVEASHRLGGKIQTLVKDGFVIERGPDSFLARKRSAAQLAEAVGLKDSLVHNATGKSYVLAKDRLYAMPGGAIMGIPTQIAPFVTTGLFSPFGKARAAFDFILPRSGQTGDQSLGEFFRRRLGDEVVDNLIEPLLSGIYAGDINQMSLMSTFPQFYQVEQKYRSLILGMKKAMPAPPPTKGNGEAKKGMFQTLNTGLQSYVDAIEAELTKTLILKSTRVKHVSKMTDNMYDVYLNNGEHLRADAIIVTTPHQITESIFPDYEFFAPFRNVPSTSVATVALAFNEGDVENTHEGTGFVVSRNSDYTITACTWTNKKWPHSAPEGKVLLRCYVGRAGDEMIVDLSDDEIVKIVLDDLSKIMNVNAQPLFSVVSRWKESMPQYTIGHKDRIKEIKENMQTELPGVYLAGSSYEGLGLPDCIDQGIAAVEKVEQFLKNTPKKELAHTR